MPKFHIWRKRKEINRSISETKSTEFLCISVCTWPLTAVKWEDNILISEKEINFYQQKDRSDLFPEVCYVQLISTFSEYCNVIDGTCTMSNWNFRIPNGAVSLNAERCSIAFMYIMLICTTENCATGQHWQYIQSIYFF